jgi:hypothetical protein
MRYKVIGLALVLLIAGVSTVTAVAAYEFNVFYDENAEFVKVEFPGAPPVPELKEGELPPHQLIKVIPLGEIICTKGQCTTHSACILRRCPKDCLCFAPITFSGDGKIVRFSPPGGEIKEKNLIPLERARIIGVTEFVNLGDLLIFKTPDKKFLRCLHINGRFFTSPPSDN